MKLNIADRTLIESAFAIAQVVFPHTYEFIGKTELPNFWELRKEAAAPMIQGQRVM